MSDSSITAAQISSDFDYHIYEKTKKEGSHSLELVVENEKQLEKNLGLDDKGINNKFAKALNNNITINVALNESPFDEANSFEFTPKNKQV